MNLDFLDLNEFCDPLFPTLNVYEEFQDNELNIKTSKTIPLTNPKHNTEEKPSEISFFHQPENEPLPKEKQDKYQNLNYSYQESASPISSFGPQLQIEVPINQMISRKSNSQENHNKNQNRTSQQSSHPTNNKLEHNDGETTKLVKENNSKVTTKKINQNKSKKKPQNTREYRKKVRRHGKVFSPEEIKRRKELASIVDIRQVKSLSKEDRKLRRLELNRVSAKRARMKKQGKGSKYVKEISDLRSLVEELKEQMSIQRREIVRLNERVNKTEAITHSDPKFVHNPNKDIKCNNSSGFCSNDEETPQKERVSNSRKRRKTKTLKQQVEKHIYPLRNKKSIFGTALFSFLFFLGFAYNIGLFSSDPSLGGPKVHHFTFNKINVDTLHSMSPNEQQNLYDNLIPDDNQDNAGSTQTPTQNENNEMDDHQQEKTLIDDPDNILFLQIE
ncbi:bzip transcription factor [Anaeramoeba flamelloides]|uniref:Bzip transcription factor n=1 Tax=Anaeramoeba flamelloides TaxID=1746091 RepID=A0AAV7ZTC2_9EUKA|nr:bzip transcription factor [Anaeramoeba flamelloides]